MADPKGVDVREGSGQLVQVQLHEEHREGLLTLVVRPRHAVHRLRHELQDQIQIKLIRLFEIQ